MQCFFHRSQDKLSEDTDLTPLKSREVFVPAALHEELHQRLILKNHWDETIEFQSRNYTKLSR